MQVISAVAEFKKDLLIERTHAGIARAIAEGKRFARPTLLNREQQEGCLRIKNGESISTIARVFNANGKP